MTTTMAGVSAFVLPAALLPTSFNCPTSRELPTQAAAAAYGHGSQTLEMTKTNSALVSSPSSPSSSSSPSSILDSWRFASSSSRYAILSASARLRWFSRPQPRGVRQLQVLNYNSRHLRREWEKRCGAQLDRSRVAAERAMKFQQQCRNAVFSNARARSSSSLQPRGGRQLQSRSHRSLRCRREWKEICVAQQETSLVVRRRAMKFEHQQGKRSMRLQSWGGNYSRVAKRKCRHGVLNDLGKRVGSEEREQDDPGRAKKVRRKEEWNMPVWKPAPSFSFYEWLKESDRNFEKRVLGDSHMAGEVWEEEEETEEKDNNSPSSSANVAEIRRAPKYPQTDEPIVHLRNEENGAQVYIVGTSHISRKSVDQVREVIHRVQPKYVLVELCRQRYDSLELRKSEKKISFLEHIVEKITKGSASALARLLGAALAGFSRMQPHHNSYPGQEFQVAMEEGKRVGAEIVLGDQDIEKTLMLLGDFDLNMSMQDAFRLFGQPMPSDMAKALGTGQDMSKAQLFERFRDRKVVRRFNEEMQKGAPRIHKVLVDDRNKIMAEKLRSLPGTVVAVVGLAHVDGLEQLWHEYNEKC